MKYTKVREFKKQLLEMGATHVRTNGSHEVWKLTNGRNISIVAGNGEVTRNVMHHVRKIFRESGISDPF